MAEAKAIYTDILSDERENVAALHLLGVVKLQDGDAAAAVELIGKAIALKPDYAEAHNNLGNALKDLERPEEAVAAFRKAAELKPDYAEAHNNLGNMLKIQGRLDEAMAAYRKAVELKADYAEAFYNLALVLVAQGNPADAEAAYLKALTVKPNFTAAYNDLGNTLKDLGRLEDAVAAFHKALEQKPHYAEAHNNLGNALKDLGRFDQAMAAYHKALQFKPDYAMAHNNIGVLLMKRDEPVEAEAAYRKALELKPDYVMALSNLGMALRDQGRLEEAVAAVRKALELEPDFAEAYCNLGTVFEDQGRLTDAEAAARKALELKPDIAAAHSNLGNAFRGQGKLVEAVASYHKALELDPDYAMGHNNLASALKDQGRLEEAMSAYRKSLELQPEQAEVHSNMLFVMNYDDRYAQEDIFAESRRWEEVHGAPQGGGGRRHANLPDPARRLRVGYVSPDFREHSVSYFLEPLLEEHDRSRFEVFCYAEVANPGDATARFRSLADGWYSTVGEKDAAIAERVQEDGIDILVDLAGHTANNRLRMFAHRPAPVQVSWLGYPNTTGLSAMDYRLTDAIADPQGADDALYSEILVRLPEGFLCYGPPADAPEVAGLPALEGGHVTFGSFNNLPKVAPRVVEVWARILDAVAGSRLLIKSGPLADDETRARYLEMFAAHGTDTGRIELLSRIPSKSGHLGAYGRVDIGLDPFPYNGTTTTCEALWMGVPVITLAGDRHSGRVGASLLTRVGLGEFITGTEEAYVAAAVKLAHDRDRLADLRKALRGRLQGSPLCDSEGFARQVEAAYRDMWRKWCEDKQAIGSK
ncbi:MAG: tetratricopeptide repeat protein [Alphaproteobacteria bacterium]|nr:tetratricopeptide repeat protein [Alphaproteobacteria bacterium]